MSQPTNEQLLALDHDDYIAISPVPSKADSFNTILGAHPLYIRFVEKDRNAAAALRDLAVAVGPGARQPSSPVFVNSTFQPLSAKTMATVMHRAMVHVVGPGSARLSTWHSSRIYLATHLMQCKVPASTIQAMLRWQTDEG